MKIRIILADDHAIFRDGLRALLEDQPRMQVLAEADNGREAVRLARELSPELVVMDVTMPGLNGVEATRQITSVSPKIKVIALSMHADQRRVAEMLAAGASGYLLKNSAFEELIRAIDAVVEHGNYFSPPVIGPIVREYLKLSSREHSADPSLTPREREVLQLLAEGNSSKETGFMLGLNVKTIDTHRQRIMKKLKLYNLADLTRYAIREGLTSLDLPTRK
jgi:DNA-binding NarL/FixJ family response regulator